MTAPARLLLAAALTMAPLVIAQETPPAEPAPESQPDSKEQPKPAPDPTKPTQPDSTPKPAPAPTPAPTPQPATPPAPAAPETPAEVPAGRQLFLAAAEVVKKAHAITYRAKSYPEGSTMLTNSVSHSQADVRMLRATPTPGAVVNHPWLIRATGSGGSMSVKDGTEFDMAWLGIHSEWVDHTAKKVLEKSARDTKGAAVGIPPASKIDEIAETNPYSQAIAAPDYVIETQRERDGVMCDSILVINGKTKVRWMLGVDDHLPRWRERIIEGNIAAGSMILEITNITVDNNDPPRMTSEMLRVTVPEGYTEERTPMPPPPAPPAPAPDKLTPAPDSKPGAPTTPPPPPPPPAPVVLKAPDFDLKDAKGQGITLASLKGNVVVLEFGGTWCLPLRDAHPELETFTKEYKDLPVKVFMLDVREKVRANATDDIAKGSYSFGLLMDADLIAKAYSIKMYPSYVVIDKDGNINKTEGGFKNVETINAVRDAVNHLTGASIAKKEVPTPPPVPEEKPAPEIKPVGATPPKVAPVFKPAPKK